MKARLPIGMDVWPVECPEKPSTSTCVRRSGAMSRSPVRGNVSSSRPPYRQPRQADSARAGSTWHAGIQRPPRPGTGAFCHDMVARTWSRPTHPPLGGWSPLRTDLRTRPRGLPVTTIRTITQFKGRLFTTPAGSRGGNPNIRRTRWCTRAATRRMAAGSRSATRFRRPNNKTIFEMVGFGDHLYVGTFNLAGYQVWRSTVRAKNRITSRR